MEPRGRPRVTAESLEPVLRAAVRLIAGRGGASVTMRDMADAAGVSVGRLQHHFGNRSNLIRTAQSWYLLSVVEDVARIACGPEGPWDRLMGMCLHAAASEDRHQRALIWIDLLAQSPRDPGARQLVTDINERWCDVMEEIIAEGESLGDFSPVLGIRETAETLVLLVDGLDVAAVTGLAGAPSLEHRLAAAAGALLGWGSTP